MAMLIFFIALALSTPFPTHSKDQDDTNWKSFESFTQYQIRKANNYFLTLNDTQKLDLFENWSGGADLGKRLRAFLPSKFIFKLGAPLKSRTGTGVFFLKFTLKIFFRETELKNQQNLIYFNKLKIFPSN